MDSAIAQLMKALAEIRTLHQACRRRGQEMHDIRGVLEIAVIKLSFYRQMCVGVPYGGAMLETLIDCILERAEEVSQNIANWRKRYHELKQQHALKRAFSAPFQVEELRAVKKSVGSIVKLIDSVNIRETLQASQSAAWLVSSKGYPETFEKQVWQEYFDRFLAPVVSDLYSRLRRVNAMDDQHVDPFNAWALLQARGSNHEDVREIERHRKAVTMFVKAYGKLIRRKRHTHPEFLPSEFPGKGLAKCFKLGLLLDRANCLYSMQIDQADFTKIGMIWTPFEATEAEQVLQSMEVANESVVDINRSNAENLSAVRSTLRDQGGKTISSSYTLICDAFGHSNDFHLSKEVKDCVSQSVCPSWLWGRLHV